MKNKLGSVVSVDRIKFIRTRVPDVILVEPPVFKDARGFFLETYHAKKYAKGGIAEKFVQCNRSHSVKGILRGLHFQLAHPQGKLVSVIEGEIFDVAVDVRKGSPSFKQWVGLTLSGDNFKQLYLPPGFAHGFCTLSESVQFQYQCTDFYNPTDEMGIRWNDPDLNIQWPLTEPTISDKDGALPFIKEIINKLPHI